MDAESWKELITVGADRLSSTCRIIRDNLTFDNPGLFTSKKIISQILQNEVEGCNLWLVHQYIYILNEHKDDT